MIKEATKEKMTREQWITVKTMSSAVMTLNAVFCGSDQMEEAGIDLIVQGISEECAGKMPLEDAIEVLTKALTIKQIKQEKDDAEESNK